jgi:hypothetical protein
MLQLAFRALRSSDDDVARTSETGEAGSREQQACGSELSVVPPQSALCQAIRGLPDSGSLPPVLTLIEQLNGALKA